MLLCQTFRVCGAPSGALVLTPGFNRDRDKAHEQRFIESSVDVSKGSRLALRITHVMVSEQPVETSG